MVPKRHTEAPKRPTLIIASRCDMLVSHMWRCWCWFRCTTSCRLIYSDTVVP